MTNNQMVQELGKDFEEIHEQYLIGKSIRVTEAAEDIAGTYIGHADAGTIVDFEDMDGDILYRASIPGFENEIIYLVREDFEIIE